MQQDKRNHLCMNRDHTSTTESTCAAQVALFVEIHLITGMLMKIYFAAAVPLWSSSIMQFSMAQLTIYPGYPCLTCFTALVCVKDNSEERVIRSD